MARPGRQDSQGESENPGSLSRADYYTMVRAQIDSENELSNFRVLWLLIAESFFITGYATVLNSPEIKNATMEFQHQMLFWVLPIAALIAGILAFLGVVGSARRVGQLRSYYDEYERRSGEHDASTVAYPPLQPEAMVDRLSRLSLYGLPILFVIIWIAILLSQTLKGGL